MAKERASTEVKDWRAGADRADAARANVAEQLAALITEREMTGAEELFALRIRQIAEARKRGDRVAMRAAIMEACVSGAHWCAAIDLRQGLRPAA